MGLVVPDNGDGTPLYRITPYNEREWDWITHHHPRKKWGLRVAYVSDEEVLDTSGQSRFYRFVQWWFGLPGKWL